jgi:hypothetical protein
MSYKGGSRHDHLPVPITLSDHRIRICILYQAPYQVVDASDLLRIRIFTIVIIKALYHHCTFDDWTKTDTTWDGPYHNGESRSRIMIRVSLPVHICDHDTCRRYGYGDRIGQIIYIWTRRNLSIKSIYTWDRLRSDGDGLTTCHVCSITHSYMILVKRERLGGVSETALLPFRG